MLKTDARAYVADPKPVYTFTPEAKEIWRSTPDNPSGIHPTEFKVLIDPIPVEEKTAGGIILADMTREHDKFAQIKGRVVAVSPLAFSYATADEWKAAGARKPAPGDVVLYAKYAGVRAKGKDGKEYLIVNDKDLTALIEE